MDDPSLMSGVQSLGNLLCDRQRFFDRQRAGCELLGERRAFDELQHETERRARAAIERLEPVDGADVGMVEGGERLRLAAEPRNPFGIRRDVGRQDLDRNLAAEDRVSGPINRPHAARAEQRLHAIRAELRPNHDRRIIAHQVGNRLIHRPIDHDRLVDVGQHRLHLTLEGRIIGTGLADERQPLGRLEEDGGLEDGGHALPVVVHDALSRSLPKRLAERKRKKDNGAES